MNNNKSFDKLDTMIHKIFKFLTTNDKYKIKSYITNSKTENQLKTNIEHISTIILRYATQKPNEHRQYFIVSKIISYIMNHTHIHHTIDNYNDNNINVNENIVMADIGGGNGNVLSGLNDHFKQNKTQFISIESESNNNWIEEYQYNHENIAYMYWDNTQLMLPDNHCDVILCMVSLHHMNDETIHTTLQEIYRVLKTGGILMIKEHDANNEVTNMLIHWEHHLYHILDCAYNKKMVDAKTYVNQHIHNFKSIYVMQQMIEQHQFILKSRMNRFLDGNYTPPDVKNPTNLYWDIYYK